MLGFKQSQYKAHRDACRRQAIAIAVAVVVVVCLFIGIWLAWPCNPLREHSALLCSPT